MQKYVVITAGGTGVRMNSPVPKQFMIIQQKPILLHTIDCFLRYEPEIEIILVLPDIQMTHWAKINRDFGFNHQITVASGGPTRFHSVKNGLKYVPEGTLVAIHDAVRPLVSYDTIAEAFRMADKLGNAIPVIPVNESVRMVENSLNKPIDRAMLRIVQTPQCFRSSIIKKAYETPYMEEFTDDASVLEKAGERINLSTGNKENIKITTAEDIVLTESVMAAQKSQRDTSYRRE